jgi:transcription antitermination factor NusG
MVSYLPRRLDERRVRRTDRTRVLELPLFPRYLFARLNHHADLYRLHQVPEIEAVLSNNGSPLRIPSDAIEDLMAAQDMGLFDTLRQRGPVFAAGEHVRIAEGPFSNFPAVISSISASSARVIVSLFGSDAVAKIPVKALRKAA